MRRGFLGRWSTPCTAVAAVTLPVLLSSCVWAQHGAGLSETDKLQQQAQAALSRWADTVAEASGHQGVVLVGELTVQVGDWELAVGDNDKPALMAGLVQPAISLPQTIDGAGQVAWQDGTTQTVAVISAQQAIAAIASDAVASGGANDCPGCQPLRITGARLTSTLVSTTRGSAMVPAWEFTFQGTAVKVTRVAIADPVTVALPDWKGPPWGDGGDAPAGISISSATAMVGGRQLVVGFLGAPLPGAQACGADYTAAAVESSLALVVIVTPQPGPGASACEIDSGPRTALVTLAAPLGARTVLEVTQGGPVAVSLVP